MGESFNMRAIVLLSVIALAAAAPKKLSSKFLSTPMARGGGRMVGGTEAYPGEFPHQIALLRGGVGGSLMCGGSLVAADRFITAGHCCDGQSASRLGVRVGSHNLYEDDPDQADIAVDTIGIPSSGQEYPSGHMCTVSGWGTTSEGGSLACTLMKVEVPVVSDDDCRDAYGQNDIAASMICAGLDAGGKVSCQGDSGGPFMCGFGLDGIVSWGYGCAQPGFPGVYTQTSYFVSWINSHM